MERLVRLEAARGGQAVVMAGMLCSAALVQCHSIAHKFLAIAGIRSGSYI
jgi:hypothetical protein